MMRMEKDTLCSTQLISAAFILLWVYTAGSKLVNFATYKLEMEHQVFSLFFSHLLIILIPAAELFTALLLLFSKTNKLGLIFSLLLIFSFTVYIALILVNYFPKIPCSCGGVIGTLGWKAHLVLNLIFLAAAILALFNKPKREVCDKE